MAFISRQCCSYSTSFTSRLQNTSQSRTLVPAALTAIWAPWKDGSEPAAPTAAAPAGPGPLRQAPAEGAPALPSPHGPSLVGAPLPSLSFYFVGKEKSPPRGLPASLFLTGLLHAAPWDAPQPPRRAARHSAGRIPPDRIGLCCPERAACVTERSPVCTHMYFQLPAAGRTECPAGPARKAFSVSETLRAAESGASESSLLQSTSPTKTQHLWDTLDTFWSHSVTCTYTEYGLIPCGQGQRSCCVHWTTSCHRKNISNTSSPLHANIAWQRLGISQMLHSSSFQWCIFFFFLCQTPFWPLWSEKHAKDKATI